MTDNIVSFDFNGVKVIKDANTKLIRLTALPASSDETFHNSADDSNYRVPSGKKATIIYIEKWRAGSSASTISYADNLDGDTNAVDLWAPVDSLVDDTLFISAEVPALKYINFIYVSGSNISVICYIVEENA